MCVGINLGTTFTCDRDLRVCELCQQRGNEHSPGARGFYRWVHKLIARGVMEVVMHAHIAQNALTHSLTH